MSYRVNSSLAPLAHDYGPGREQAILQRFPAQFRLSISDLLLRRIVAHMQRCLPDEGVGLLATIPGKDGPVADAYYPGTNVAASATRFRMRPQEVQRAIEDMKRRTSLLGAIIHSHPTTVAEPSPIDLKEATLADALSIIVGFEPRLSIRAWRLLFNTSGEAYAAVECPIDVTAVEIEARERTRMVDEWLKA